MCWTCVWSRPHSHDHLDGSLLGGQGHALPVCHDLQEHPLAGPTDQTNSVWNILMFSLNIIMMWIFRLKDEQKCTIYTIKVDGVPDHAQESKPEDGDDHLLGGRGQQLYVEHN